MKKIKWKMVGYGQWIGRIGRFKIFEIMRGDSRYHAYITTSSADIDIGIFKYFTIATSCCQGFLGTSG